MWFSMTRWLVIWTKISCINDAAALQKGLDSLSRGLLSPQNGSWSLIQTSAKVMHIGHQYKTNYTIRQDNTDCNILEIVKEKDLEYSQQVLWKSRDRVMKLLLKQRDFRAWFIDSLKILIRKVSWSFIQDSLDHIGVCNTNIETWYPYLKGDVTSNKWKKYSEGRRS